jgi:hypothetical protein
MMSKLIIDNRTDMSMFDAMRYAAVVIQGGRISNDGRQYCYGTSFTDDIFVYSTLNKNSDRLVITRMEDD